MDEGLHGLLALLGLSGFVALVLHANLRSFWRTSMLAAAIAVVAFQLLAYIRLGYLDPFFLIAVVVSFIFAFVVAALIGKAIQLVRSKR